MTRRVSGRAWKLIGLAGVAGVAATGVVLARNERRRRAYTPEEIRLRLHERHVEALAAEGAAGPDAATDAGPESAAAQRSARLPDPLRIARHETDAWVGYYRREWARVLRGALGMVHEGFGTSPAQTLRGAWWVLRANQAWAPYPVNEPDAARACMTRFYAIAAKAQGWSIDPREAARLEVEWWAAHRAVQRVDSTERDSTELDSTQLDARLIGALTDLYAYVYSVPPERVRVAAEHRAAAMRLSDAWVDAGCAPDDARLADEEAELVLSYTALSQALRR